jgi:thymidylate synthase (FAD)
MEQAEYWYMTLLKNGCSPQEARTVLPNSLKTEIVMTANLREWRHFFKLRCAPDAHPQMREIAMMMLEEFRKLIPVVFDDLNTDDCNEKQV